MTERFDKQSTKTYSPQLGVSFSGSSLTSPSEADKHDNTVKLHKYNLI